ncbi:MAG: sugar phosphate isomerase/epimerase family protein [Armatimonadota bacterium]
MSEIPLGVSTWTFSRLLPQDLRDIVDGKAPLGRAEEQSIHAYFVELVSALISSDIEKVELWYSEILWENQVMGQLNRLASTERVASMHAPFGPELDLSALDESARREAVDACIRAARLLANLGGKTLVVHGSWRDIGSEMPDRERQSVRSISEIADLCAELGLRVAVEHLVESMVGSTAPEMLSILKLAGRENVGVCLDVNHVFPPEALVPTVYALASHIFSLHISDNNGAEEKHWLPMLGVIDWRALIAALQRVGYDGPFIYEVDFEAPSIARAVSIIEENYRAL